MQKRLPLYGRPFVFIGKRFYAILVRRYPMIFRRVGFDAREFLSITNSSDE